LINEAMKMKTPLLKKCILLFVCAFSSLMVFSGSPGLIWHQTYGETPYVQQVVAISVDNYDNTFAVGFVNFGTNGNILINMYDGVGVMMWNRMYNNPQTSNAVDKPVALFPDNQAGVSIVGYVNGRAIVTHILKYDPTGSLVGDVAIGDTTAGSKTVPVAVIYDGTSAYYMIGQLNNVAKVFKCDNTGNVLWSAPLHNDYNNQVGSIDFDNYGSVVVGVSDSATAQVIIHRYDQTLGTELPGFNTHVDSLPVNDNFIKVLVDPGSNIYLAATGKDSLGRTQLVVDKFDTTGALLASTMCNSTKGHSNTVNSFMLDNDGDIIISGPFSDDTDIWQFGAVYKVANGGGVVWAYVDSQFLVNNASAQVDLYNNIYIGCTKTPFAISPYYTDFSITQLTPDSGRVEWNRNFDNSANNTGLLMQVNNFGDVFLATTITSDTGDEWFLARIGNNANDSVGTGVEEVIKPATNLTIFPNPFSLATNISFNDVQDEALTLKVYDVMGRLLQQRQIQSVTGINQIAFNAALAPGVYLFKMEGANGSSVQQAVVY
jgi:hypothetical protein